ncbi:geranylgeranyl reductase family protein [Terrimonas sp. NA20]|uniref:Geranylgeranyl reductase family protein n=1 Tax=Terrimonas ginsenosidimutans TaxID=2908004 RepID=A0ABS9KM70_9BACT|nr:geranylgeranyl reductase family protein [Terrimonas ginsenosidimutans]MCG2613414.1 geranylgeranyl reductase family protein [Terrimonas ginsenosidimutans]
MLIVRTLNKYDCDVLIAGGGPAGSGLAFHLASQGYKVIVVDAESFPRDKVCGDGVSPIALAELQAMGITQTEKFASTNEIKQVGLFIKNDKVIINLSKPDHLPFHAHIIPRVELDQWIVSAAQKAGATYLENTRVTGFEIRSGVAIAQLKQGRKNFTLNAKMIVGADGSRSVVARQLNGKPPDSEFQLVGLRAYYEKVNGPTDRVDIYFSEESFPGIFWMFPKGPAGANIGMAMVSKTLPTKTADVKQLLINHIARNKDIRERIGNGQMEGKIMGWPITFYNSKTRIIGDRVLLAGDAAGLINPLSGDGIQYALLSARWAAETISHCLQANDLSVNGLQSYQRRVNAELGYDFALSNLLVQFPRNRSLSKLWMTILEVMIARAKQDPKYADTIAGIFEGTYPSYKALNASFILNSVKQGATEFSEGFKKAMGQPGGLIATGLQATESITALLSELSTYQKDHIDWMKNTLGKTAKVAAHIITRMNANGR